MKHFIINFLFLLASLQLVAQTGQLNINRVSQMPNIPTPLQIRDWKSVAVNYDAFVFDASKTGQYMPLSRLGTQGQFNYPDNIPIFLDTYVGASSHLNQAEAINIIPAIVGASLVGIDKSNQNGLNWVSKVKDFFNVKNGQNVYLNNYNTSSGGDWWYDLMPNVYFYQLKSLYPEASVEFDSQFSIVANRWLYAVRQLGGSTTPWTKPNMNYRAFNLATGEPLNSSVPEPESAGSIAWLLYNAYLQTGNREYFEGAQLSMDFLAEFQTNPSYELQLPYGTLVASRMNAIEGTNYPLQKLLDWCFNRGQLRGWGAIVGNWGGYDISGLIGEANDSGNDYAFIMNGFQQVGALAPIPKYDKRYARDIAKWILNVANASRLFYWNALPQDNQDSYLWSSINDPDAVIPHEAMKQLWQGKTPYATGDAIAGKWAATNLSLYSGSSVGYLASVIKTTNVPEILQIDLNRTDFYGENSLPSFMYYNPTQTSRQVDVSLPPGTFDVYDAITETVVSSSVTGSFTLSIPAGEVRVIRLFTSGIVPQSRDGKFYAGEDILDYNYGYQFTSSLRIKSLSTDEDPVLINSTFTAYCEPGNVSSSSQVVFEWFINDNPVAAQNQSQATLSAPATPGMFTLKCRATFNGQIAEDTLMLRSVEHIARPPVVNGITSDEKYVSTGGMNIFTAKVEPQPGETLHYEWSSTEGTLGTVVENAVSWQAPATPVVSNITVKVTNQDNLTTTVSTSTLVKNTTLTDQTPLIWYPFDFDNLNAVSNLYHATASGVTKSPDFRGIASLAYRFTSGDNIVYTPNNAQLNFSQAVSLSCWIKCEQLGSERFIVSHGSWQQRYKLSLTPEGLIRWTVKTSSGTSDLDASSPIIINQYYHVTVLYTGYSMELYIDGVLDTFKAFTGALQPSTRPITIGRMDDVETLYSMLGSIDEVKIWDKEIPVTQVESLNKQWATQLGINELENVARIYPNPTKGVLYIEFISNIFAQRITLYTINGAEIAVYNNLSSNPVKLQLPDALKGTFILRVVLDDGNVVTSKIVIG